MKKLNLTTIQDKIAAAAATIGLIGILTAGTVCQLTGCGSVNAATSGTATTVTTSSTSKTSTTTSTGSTTTSTDSTTTTGSTTTTTITTSTDGMIDTSSLFTERDLTQTADLTGATTITLTDGEDITISEAGVYVITGTAADVTITVDAGDEDKVQIVLDNANITNTDTAAIFVKKRGQSFCHHHRRQHFGSHRILHHHR